MLSCYRAPDLTDEKGFLYGKILADLRADVIKVRNGRLVGFALRSRVTSGAEPQIYG